MIFNPKTSIYNRDCIVSLCDHEPNVWLNSEANKRGHGKCFMHISQKEMRGIPIDAEQESSEAALMMRAGQGGPPGPGCFTSNVQQSMDSDFGVGDDVQESLDLFLNKALLLCEVKASANAPQVIPSRASCLAAKLSGQNQLQDKLIKSTLQKFEKFIRKAQGPTCVLNIANRSFCSDDELSLMSASIGDGSESHPKRRRVSLQA